MDSAFEDVLNILVVGASPNFFQHIIGEGWIYGTRQQVSIAAGESFPELAENSVHDACEMAIRLLSDQIHGIERRLMAQSPKARQSLLAANFDENGCH